jgi:hypothetical protein
MPKVKEDFVPFGPEWEAEMKQFKKQELILFLRGASQKSVEMEKEVERLREALKDGLKIHHIDTLRKHLESALSSVEDNKNQK